MTNSVASQEYGEGAHEGIPETNAPRISVRYDFSLLRYAVAAVIFLFHPVCARAEPASIKIGASLALTGKLAVIGTGELEGLTMAFEEVNGKGEIDAPAIEFIVEDNQGDPKSALMGAQKLLAVDNVQLFISAFTHITQAIKHLPARAGKAMVYISSVKSIAAENEFFFRDFYDIEAAGREMAHVARARGYKEAAFLREEGEACASNEDAFNQTAQEIGLSVLRREEFSSGSTDIRSVLLRLSQKRPPVILICAWRDTATVMRQMAELKLLDIPTIQIEAPAMASVADTPEMRTLYEQNGTITTWYGYVETTSNSKVRDFVARFKKRFKHPPIPDALLAYDLGHSLADSVRGCLRSGDLDKQCFRRKLLARPHPGVTAPVLFDDTRNSLRPVLLMQVKDGKWVEVARER